MKFSLWVLFVVIFEIFKPLPHIPTTDTNIDDKHRQMTGHNSYLGTIEIGFVKNKIAKSYRDRFRWALLLNSDLVHAPFHSLFNSLYRKRTKSMEVFLK